MKNIIQKNFIRRIQSIMYAADKKISVLNCFLLAVSFGFGGIVKIREALYKKNAFKSKKLPCIVISIGNLTVGGTGKTPMTIYLAKLIKSFELSVAVISRGYKGKAEQTGGIVSNKEKLCMNAADAGDEPWMIAARLKGIPVIVGRNRFKAGSIAVKEFNPDVIILDDAFQHLQLHRDLNLVLLDSDLPFGNEHLLPRGILRESISALKRADALILTRSDFKDRLPKNLNTLASNLPVFKSAHVPYLSNIVKCSVSKPKSKRDSKDHQSLNILKNKKLFLFSGIAKNRDFYNAVNSIEKSIKGFLEFPDHYIYTQNDIKKIIRFAVESDVDYIITTEKDYARISLATEWPVDLIVIGIEISFGKETEAFSKFIKKMVRQPVNKLC